MFHTEKLELLKNTENLHPAVSDQSSDCIKDHATEINELSQFKTTSYRSIEGIAVKLSQLDELGISISTIIAVFSKKIIVDAEFDRLDEWLIKNLKNGIIQRNQLNRLVLTVQLKRFDAIVQISSLQSFVSEGLSILVVSGNEHYLRNVKTTESTMVKRFKEVSSLDGVELYGISELFKEKLYKNDLSMNNSSVLELQGYQELHNSMLWTYYGGLKLTKTTTSYISRRQGHGRDYVCRNTNDLLILNSKHQLIVFIDSCCKSLYLKQVSILSE